MPLSLISLERRILDFELGEVYVFRYRTDIGIQTEAFFEEGCSQEASGN